MERPDHNVDHQLGNQKAGARRFSGVITVIAIHVGLVALMIFGIVTKMEIQKEDLQVAVEEQKIPPKTPPPPPPAFEKPPPPFVPPPDFNIQSEAPPPRAIVAAPAPPPAPPPRVVAAAPPPPPPTKLESIERTHSKPPYPAISQRMSEQGTTEMIVTIDKTGSVVATELTKSSGSKRLDDAAMEHVKARWKWQPPTQNGQAVDGTRTAVRVIWSLLDAK